MNGPSDIAAFAAAMIACYPTLGELTGGSVVESDGVLMVAGPHRRALVANTAIRIDARIPAAAVFRTTREHYARLGYEFDLATFAFRDRDIDEAAPAEGWDVGVRLPCMVIRRRPATSTPHNGVSIRWADPERDHDIVGRIVAIGFGEEEEELAGLRAIFSMPAIIRSPGWPSVIASIEGADAAVASWTVRGGVGIVGFVATLPAYRRLGLGALVTEEVTAAAFDAGATMVGLQASPDGLPVYRRIGYETMGESTIWKPPTT